MSNAIEVKGLVKHYEKFCIEGLDFEVPMGYVTGLIGGNGAGKTTLMKCISGAVVKEQGTVAFGRKDSRIGVVFDECKFPTILDGNRLNRFMKELYPTWNSAAFERHMRDFSVDMDVIVKKMSRGMRMKTQIAAAMAMDVDILLLDEPTAGLDPVSRDEFLDIVRNWMTEDKAVLISSHITTDIEHIADMIYFLSDGKVIIHGVKDDLLENYGIARGSDLPCREQVVATRRTEYGSSSLITDKAGVREAYPEIAVDDASLEDILVYFARGEKE